MNKRELVKAVARKGELKTGQGSRAVNALVDIIGEELKQGKRVKLLGIGVFEVKERKERDFINPRTKQNVVLKKKKAPAFYASTVLKDKVKDKGWQNSQSSSAPKYPTGPAGSQGL